MAISKSNFFRLLVLAFFLSGCIPSATISQEQMNKMQDLQLQADNEVPTAQYRLGEIYYTGDGVPENLEKALKLFTQAAEQDLPEAQYSLGYMYDKGIGVTVDKQKSVRWYEAAAKNGVIIAQYNLGIDYLNGIGTEANLIKAYAWLKIAREHGTADLENSLLLIENKLNENEIVQANAYYQSLAKEIDNI